MVDASSLFTYSSALQKMNRQTRSGQLTSPGPPPSPGRPKKKSRSSSRGRKEKVEKEPPRAKSPSRKSPARNKSPSRKIAKKTSPSPNKFISKVRERVSEIRDSLTPETRIEEMIRTSATRFEEVASDYMSTVRRSTRQAAQHAAIVNSEILAPNKKMSAHENNVHAADEPKKEFGHWIVALGLSLVMTTFVIAAQLACTKESCAPIPPKISLSWRRFLDLEASGWYLGFLAVQMLLAALPLGFKADSMGRSDNFKYTANGPAVVVLTASILVGLKVYLNFPITKVLDKGLHILTTSLLTAFFLSALLYIKAAFGKKTKRHEYGNTGNFFYDAWAGAEVNPRVGPLDIKTAIIRTSFLVTIIYDALLIYKEVDGKALDQISVNVVLVAALQILFALDSILFESDLLSSFGVTQDGTGLLLLLVTALNPFWITLLPKYLYLSRGSHNVWIASVVGVISIVGLLLHRLSNHVKANFKKNPSSYPSSDVVHSRSSPIYKGGVWGLVRHPNYLGALLIYTSWTVFALTAAPLHWIPIAVWLSIFLSLLVHITRVETRAAAKHGAAWHLYCSQAKHKLIPKVF